MTNNETLINKINNYLLDTEEYANEFLPLKETLEPIQHDFKQALTELKEKSQTATELSDRVFYINRYTDLVKKVENVFDTRSKRLQQTLSMLTKLPAIQDVENVDNDKQTETDIDNTPLTPEQANKIMQILREAK